MLALLRPGWQGDEAHRQPVHLPRRQLGQHAGDRRRAQPARRGQTPRRRADRPDGLGRRRPWSSASPTPPGSSRASPTIGTPLRRAVDAIEPTPRHVAGRGPEGGLGPGQSGPQRRRGERHPGGRGHAGDALHHERRQFRARHRLLAGQPRARSTCPSARTTRPTSASWPSASAATKRGEGQLQAFARLENFGAKPVRVTADLRLDDRLIDATEVADRRRRGPGRRVRRRGDRLGRAQAGSPRSTTAWRWTTWRGSPSIRRGRPTCCWSRPATSRCEFGLCDRAGREIGRGDGRIARVPEEARTTRPMPTAARTTW